VARTAIEGYAREGMPNDYIAENDRSRERMRALIAALTDDDLARPVNDEWTAAASLAHVAFWDARVIFLIRKLQSGAALTDDDVEPDDVSWINDSARPLLHAIDPRRAAEVALEIAEQTDALVADTPAERMYPADPNSHINAFRWQHRDEHVEEIEAAVRR
jgi:hypothetical protein